MGDGAAARKSDGATADGARTMSQLETSPMMAARRNEIHAASTKEPPGVGAARLALRLVLGAIAEMHDTVAPENARAAHRRWIRTGSVVTALRAMSHGREWVGRAAGRWTRRVGSRFTPRGATVLERWARLGQFEELAGRKLLRDVANSGLQRVVKALVTRPELYEIVDEIVEHLADRPPQLTRLVNEITQSLIHDPEVKALIHEQSTSLVGSMVESFRDEAARADTAIERGVAALGRRLKMR
jgi:hypothetical protein